MDLGDRAPSVAVSVDRPLLVATGQYDWNVPPEETASWRTLLDGKDPNPGHEVEAPPCVTHALNCIDEPDYRNITVDDIGCVVHTAVTETVKSFLDRITGANPP
jgi:hypothetical protein